MDKFDILCERVSSPSGLLEGDSHYRCCGRLPQALVDPLGQLHHLVLALLLLLARASEALAEDFSFLGGTDCSSRVPAATSTAVCPQLRCRGRGIVLSPLLLLDLVGLLCI